MKITRIKDLLFQNRGTRQTIAKNIFWLSIGQVASRLIRAVIIIYAARVMGASEYGIFSYLLGLAGFFTIFADIGVNQILTREISQKPDYRSKYFSTGFWIKIFLFLATTALIIFIAPYFSKMEKVAALIHFVALIVIFDGLREFCSAIFRAKEKMELEALAIILTNASITILGFVALYLSRTSQAITFSYAIATGLGALVATLFLRKEFRRLIGDFERKLIKPIFSAAWPTALVGVLGAFMLNTDIIMLGWWRTAEEIGFYSASQRVVLALYALPAVLAGAIFPTLSRLIGQKNNDKVRQLMEISVTASLLIAIPMIIGGVILAKPIIELIYGQEYLPTVIVFKILMLTSLIIFPATLISNSILAYNRQKKMAVYIGIAAVGNIIFNSLLIPLCGIIGSAIATLVSQSINISLSWRLMKKINNFYTFRHLKKITVAGIMMGILSFAFNKLGLNVIINIIISAGIYFGILYLIKEKLLEETKNLFKIIRGN